MRCKNAILSFLALTGMLWIPATGQAADPNSPYGINTHVPSSADLDKVSQAGIAWIRVDFNWFMIETGQNSYAWGTYDNVVNQAKTRGLNVFATIAYTPGWANGNAGINVPPSNSNDWYDFVYQTVSRYKSSVKYWGMWNEPNLESFFTGSIDQYINDVLTLGAKAAKTADPSCFVLGPELAHLSSGEWPRWLHQVLTQAGDRIDIVTHHTYQDSGYEVIRAMGGWVPFWEKPTPRYIMEQAGAGDKPLWLTETGWHTDEVSESFQAACYEQVLDGVDNLDWLDKIFFYELKDDPNIPDKWGIINSDLTPKEAWYTYQSHILSRQLPPMPSVPERPGPDR